VVTLQGAIDNRLRQARIELAAGALRHQDQRVAMIAVMALVRLVQHAALRVGRTGNDQRAAGGGKTRAHRVQDLGVSVRGEFVAVPEGRLVGDDSNVSWAPQSPEARRANLDVDRWSE